VREMTSYETIRNIFNDSATCRNGKRPELNYEPGCLYVECAEGDKCRCRLADGEGGPVSAFLIRWRERYG